MKYSVAEFGDAILAQLLVADVRGFSVTVAGGVITGQSEMNPRYRIFR
jgi:hypothetical protein